MRELAIVLKKITNCFLKIIMSKQPDELFCARHLAPAEFVSLPSLQRAGPPGTITV